MRCSTACAPSTASDQTWRTRGQPQALARGTAGLTEGTETVIAYVAICLLPEHAGTIAWVFAAMVLFTVGQRVALAVRVLG